MARKNNRFQKESDSKPESIFPPILKYGGIGGVLSLLIGVAQSKVLGQMAVDESSSMSFLPILIFLVADVLYILMMILAINTYKKSNNGLASFKKAFLITFLTSLLVAFLGWIFTLILVYTGVLPETTMGLDKIDSSKDSLVVAFFRILFGAIPSLLSNCMYGGFMALIISLVFKKSKPPEL